MITLSHLSDHNNFRTIIIDRFTKAEDAIYPLNEYIASFILKKDFISLKDFALLNPSTYITIDKWKRLISTLKLNEISAAKEYVDTYALDQDIHPAYIYVGSKNSLRQVFYDFIPSAFDHTFNYLSSNYITQVGPGKGSAFVIHPTFFSSTFSDFTPNTASSLDILSRVTAEFKSLQSDNEYLYSLLSEKDQTINSLINKISDLEHQNYITSQITWR